ncbi:membrane protein [Aliiroseovarius zhejiangensis]|uniref:High-affinity zinc uptake system membrane protein ZnuB n=1 Tax=Aliiroseovarius zhejiangensis TaxID=1632025 RepID=A0ABQ3ILV5_9RHOB|nr:metal ABC transporter permease [Aliiroseovarius zhejiangensis]GHE87607.1 membrane protein [Aliiroseovarius zhejiangensis]
MLDDFLLRAALAGIGVSIATGPLGSFVVWRRMAYFGDATAHAAILGVALALLMALPIWLGTLVIALAMALAISWMSARGQSPDTGLGVLSYSALSAGLVAISFAPGVRVDLSAFLFGDILAVTRGDLVLVWGGALAIAGLIAWRWSRLLLSTLSPDLAAASGINPTREGIVLTLSLAIVVAVSLKVVGALLISALLIIPAAAARLVSSSPVAMAVTAVLIGWGASLAGLWGSLQYDTPAGPSIIVAAALIYLVLTGYSTVREA